MKLILSILISLIMVAGTARAEVKKQFAQMYCGKVKEIESIVSDYDKILEGQAGTAGTNGVGEVWLNVKTSEWFFIQKVEDGVTACIVLGGNKFKHAIAGQGL